MSIRVRLALLPFFGVMSGCAADSPTSPTDPSTLTAPRLVQPAQGATVTLGGSPLMLVVDNASSAAAPAPTYTFEIATDQSFATRVFVQEGVAQGDGGRTSVAVTAALDPGVTYVWRARAQSWTSIPRWWR